MGLLLPPVLLPALLATLLTGCATSPDTDRLAGGDGSPSRHAEQRDGGAAGDSDAVHVPPVAHDPAVRPLAEAATDEYFRALQYLRQNDLQRARIAFQSLSNRYPALSGPQVNLGLIELRARNWDQAIVYLRQAIETNPANPYAHNALGAALRLHGDFTGAEQHYREAINLDPRYARAWFNRGVLAELYQQDLQAALAYFRTYQSLQRQPDPTVANWIADLERRVPTDTLAREDSAP